MNSKFDSGLVEHENMDEKETQEHCNHCFRTGGSQKRKTGGKIRAIGQFEILEMEKKREKKEPLRALPSNDGIGLIFQMVFLTRRIASPFPVPIL